MRICDRWMQEGMTDQRGRSHPPQCTTAGEDRQIVRMAVMDHSVTSRTIAQITGVSTANGAMKEGCKWQNGMKLSLLTSHASVCNTTMVRFESGDTVKRGC
ncbi:UNVERIFIED_CONTAM: hypothetical protein NCL1_40481 [Trichonephila clavipes]